MTIMKNGLNLARKGVSFVNNQALKIGVGVVLVSGSAHAAAPTSLDGFSDQSATYIGSGTTTAIAAATLGLGWVGYKIVKKFTKGAAST